MAKNNFTFQAALKLNSAGFKKGVNEVKTALAGLKNSFLSLAGALGAGLGFTQFISQMKDTATQLSVAKSVLENVSKVTKEYTDGVSKGSVEISNYAENLEYVRRLAKDYSQDLVGLIENFAQFHAACEKTNLDLEQQKDVYEALTKAAAYYHMSADRTRDMMTAVTQMMSKGKVSAEELRRQLGNALPGAFNLMAAAIGVSTAELEEMMKKGQVISSEVLPRFAAMLNTVTKSANFDSLQMSMNDLRNTWYEFVEKSGAENIFKGVVKGANSVLATVSNNINLISSLIKGLIAAVLGSKLLTYLEKRGKEYFAGLEKGFEQANKAFNKASQDVKKYNDILKQDRSTGAITPKKGHIASKADLDRMIAYNQELARVQRAQNQLYGGPGPRDFYLDEGDIKKLEAANERLKEARKTIETAGTKSRGFLATLGGGLKSIGLQIKGFIASLGAVAAISAIIGGLTAIYSYIKKIKEEQKRVNAIFSEYQESLKLSNQSVEENSKLLSKNLEIMQDETRNPVVRRNALAEINKMMGTSYNTDALEKTKKQYKEIVEEVKRWIEATKTQAKVQVLASKAAEAEIEIQKINIRNSELKKEREKLAKGLFTGFKLGKIEIEEGINKKALEEYNKILQDANKGLDDLQVKWLELINDGKNLNGGGDNGKPTDIGKVFEDYNKELEELSNKLREHAITQEEYNEEFDKLVTKFWENAAATGKYSIDDILNKPIEGKTLTKMEQWYKDLYEAAQRAAFNATAKAASEAIDKAIEEAVNEAGKQLDEELQKMLDKIDKNIAADISALSTEKPGKNNRDSTFDYKKTQSDIKGEQLDINKDYIKDLEDAIDTIVSKYDNLEDASEAVRKKLSEWQEELSLAKKEAATLEEAMKFAKIQEDIEELKKSITSTVFGGIRNMASSMDRVVKGVEALKDTFEDSDSTGWEKFMAVFNELLQIIDTFIGAIQTIQTIQKLSNQLDGAEAALIATKISLLEKELALRQALAAVKATEVKQTEAQVGANLAEAASAKAATSAKAGDAIAGATASGAKLPFPYNLIAIAGGIASVIGALALISKYASGGIVGGNSFTGDKQLARVNSGEMILNKGQQATLFKAIQSGNLGGGGNVEFKIRGADLVGTLNNYNRLRRGY